MNRRISRVNGLLRQEISSMLASELNDPRLSSFVTITGVETSSDLRSAKVYISVLGEATNGTEALWALNAASGYINRSIKKKVNLRNVPVFRFYLDDSIEKGIRMMELMEQVSTQDSRDEADS